MLHQGDHNKLLGLQGALIRTKCDGELEWRSPTREEIRSDSHRLMWFLSGHFLELYGSPARLGNPNNVFGDRCLQSCARRMVDFFCATTGCDLPVSWSDWECTRVDVTQNYAMASESEVREALRCLASVQGGHFRVSSNSGTVYWNKSSSLRCGKAYHKGPHLAYQRRKRQAGATDEQIALCERVLRLELSLRSQWWRERAGRAWNEWTVAELEREHIGYFGKMVGAIEVVEMNDILKSLQGVAKTTGGASAAYNTWLAIRAEGLENVRGRMQRATFQRHKRLLFDAGMTWADLQASNVVPFRRRTIELGAPVHSWEELRAAA